MEGYTINVDIRASTCGCGIYAGNGTLVVESFPETRRVSSNVNACESSRSQHNIPV